MKKKRADCFFGLHFDFHAAKDTRMIGKNFDIKELEKILETVKPDYVQCDTKGHAGYSSYPTKAGTPAPDIHTDILKGWREATKKYGILLFAHHSGIYDDAAGAEHPDWQAVNRDGSYAEGRMTPFGGYADGRLIPQLKELALDYGLDGAWVDGECWAMVPDFSQKAREEYTRETGKPVPGPDDDMEDYRRFCRKSFTDYVKHYVTEVKKAAPDFEITSNWLNSSSAPEDVDITDFVSGDLSPCNCVHFARFDGRILAAFGKNWDIMAWGFNHPQHNEKTFTQLAQEAACIISLGGGFQLYNMQSPYGVVRTPQAVPEWAELAKFCRARQSFSHKSTPIPDVGLVFSQAAYFDRKTALYAGSGNNFFEDFLGTVQAIADAQLPFSVLLSFKLKNVDLSEYKMLVINNLTCVEPELKTRLLEYIRNGGILAAFGSDSALEFQKELKAKSAKKVSKEPVIRVIGTRTEATYNQNYTVLETAENSEYAYMLLNESKALPYPEDRAPACVKQSYGKGALVCVPFDFGISYLNECTVTLRELVKTAFSFYTDRKLTITGSSYADVSLMQKNGREYIHLTNTAGESRADKVKTFGEIPPLYDIKVSYRCEKPVSVMRVPENVPLEYEYKNGRLETKIARLDIHTAIEISHEK